MTTLLVSEVFPPQTGGSGRWFWEVYSRLPRQEFAIAAGEHPRQREFDKTHDLRIVRLPLGLESWGLANLAGFRGYCQAIRQLRRLLKSAGVRMIHCGKCLPEGLMALLLRCLGGPPYACYVHGEEIKLAMGSTELHYLTMSVLRGADFIIANSRNTQRLLCEVCHLPAKRVRLLYPGVDTARFRPAPPDPCARAKFGWERRPVILTVGRMQKRKGHDQMILALHDIRRVIPNVLYAIMGDGEERQALTRLVQREGLEAHVAFMGELPDADLVACYQQCDLFVLPNRQIGKDIEGFGMVLLEAQACGKAVIAGESGGTAETMRVGETGFVISCDSPQRLAGLVIELMNDRDRMERIGAAGRDWVVEHFDWTVQSAKAYRIFARAMPACRSQENIHRKRNLTCSPRGKQFSGLV